VINATSALIGLACYAGLVFSFGLLWRRREIAAKHRRESADPMSRVAGNPYVRATIEVAEHEEYVHLS
jgi:hypothetical protein